MNIRKTHSLTRESFYKMSDEKLRLIHARKYKAAADTAADQRGAQWELQHRRSVRDRAARSKQS